MAFPSPYDVNTPTAVQCILLERAIIPWTAQPIINMPNDPPLPKFWHCDHSISPCDQAYLRSPESKQHWHRGLCCSIETFPRAKGHMPPYLEETSSSQNSPAGFNRGHTSASVLVWDGNIPRSRSQHQVWQAALPLLLVAICRFCFALATGNGSEEETWLLAKFSTVIPI